MNQNSIGYTAYNLMSSLNKPEIAQKKERSKQYDNILKNVRKRIVSEHQEEYSKLAFSGEDSLHLKNLIMSCLVSEAVPATNELAEKLLRDMAGFGILEPYLKDPNVEEININGWNGIEVVYRDHIDFLKETFPSAQACEDIIKKMVRVGGETLDGTTPVVDSFIGNGVRISAIIKPIVNDKVGACASIRKQNRTIMTKNKLLEFGTVTEEQLDFLTLCLCNGISVGFAGSCGSGKTTDINYFLNEYVRKTNKRVYTIEDVSELDLIRYDENDNMTTRVIHTYTRPKPNPVTMRDLFKEALRHDPDVIVPAEMRGAEAFDAQEAGRTGHTILTSLHANSAKLAYKRILSLCTMACTGLSENLLLDYIIEAFPIMVFKKQLGDGSRKYMSIFEATGHENGQVIGQTIFKYIISETIRDKNGKVSDVRGEHKRLDFISDRLATMLFENGVPIHEIQRFASPEWKPEE